MGASGFTLLELLVVVTLIALTASLAALALRDASRQSLEQEGVRLAAVLEAARMESRATGRAVIWQPQRGFSAADGRTLHGAARWPRGWLHEGTRAEVLGAAAVVLGPDPILPPQRIRLALGERSLVVVTDGLGPFRIEEGRAP